MNFEDVGTKRKMQLFELDEWREKAYHMLVFINLSLVLIATYYKHISPNITLLGCHP